MRHARLKDSADAAARRGFSLVELLTVVAIITLLIAILVPAVNKVRESAKATATQAMLGTLDTGLNMFRQNQQIGGALPPSASDLVLSGGLAYQVRSPYSQLAGVLRRIPISGAGLLVWSMAGADLLGCPGFKDFGAGGGYWGDSTSDIPTENPLGAYALNSTTREPERARVAPFVDLSKVSISKWNPNAVTKGTPGSFEIPAETETYKTTQVAPHKRQYPMFIDDFGGPILYWRADPAGKSVADYSPTDADVTGNNLRLRGIYHYADNAALLRGNPQDDASSWTPLALTPRAERHRLYHTVSPPPVDPIDLDDNPTNEIYNFVRYIRNADVTARITPYNADSYLLISAGPDGLFGTADDIANFPHNGAALPRVTND